MEACERLALERAAAFAREGRVMDLDRHIREVVREEIARVLGAATIGTFYSNEAPAHYPPGKRTKRAARDAIRAVAGAEQIGSGPATVWRVDREAYHRHYARRVAAPLRVVLSNDEEIAAQALASFRATKEKKSA